MQSHKTPKHELPKLTSSGLCDNGFKIQPKRASPARFFLNYAKYQ
jgi:hypothetical protein